MNAPIKIDGAFGEGGGQILRTTLSISAITGQPVQVDNIRAGRAKPGLLRQHLTALRAVAEVCQGQAQGDSLGSRQIIFEPGRVQGGEYRFAIGSAGSANLVLQTVLPVLLSAPGPSTVTVEGGTHNPSSPPFEFLDRVFFPLLRRMGAEVQAHLLRPGFYPVGGGVVQVQLSPPKSGRLGALELMERGPERSRAVQSVVAHIPKDVADRELKAFTKRSGWAEDCGEVIFANKALGPGNAIMAELHYEHVSALFTAFGQRGVRAERVGRDCADQVRGYLADQVPVDEHLADQLLLPMALGAGGAFVTRALSMHARTNLEVIRQGLGVGFEVTPSAHGVTVRRTVSA